MRVHRVKISAAGCALCLVLTAFGCAPARPGTALWAPNKTLLEQQVIPAPDTIPRELDMTTMPDYTIEPSDILLIDAINVIPKPPYRISSLDILTINVQGELEDKQIEGNYVVQPGGVLDLGPPYGAVTIGGQSLEEANKTLDTHLRQLLENPEVFMTLSESAGKQQIAGEHLVGMDGHVTLGTYGKVYIAGLTQEQAKLAIENHLQKHLEEPEVSVDIYAYNSKKYYVITEGAGLGDGVFPFPITGNERVLDAIANINGTEAVSSSRIWVARPAPHGQGRAQVLPVDWKGITMLGMTDTNYQLMPGDRVFVAEDKLVKFDTVFSKVTAPVERLFGVTLLGTNTVSRLRFFHIFGRRFGLGTGQGAG